MTPTGWMEVGEHLAPLAGWRARRVVSGELEIETPAGDRHVLGARPQWARILGAEYRPDHHVPELVEALVEAEEARLEAAAETEETMRRDAQRRAVAAYNALAAAERKKIDPKPGEAG